MPIAFNILHWISGLTLISLSFYCLRKASNKLGFFLSFFFFLLAIWSLGSAWVFNTGSLELKIDITRMRQLAITLIPVSLFYLVRALIGEKKLPTYVNFSLFVIPVVSIITIISPYHEMFLRGYEIHNYWGSDLLTFKNGPVFFFHNLQARVIVAWALFLLARNSFRKHNVLQKYNWILFYSILIPFMLDTVAVSFFPHMRYIQIVPVFLTLSAICFCIVIFKGQVLEIIPVARSLILDSISDIYLSLDHNNKLIDFNACARENLDFTDDSYGKELSELDFNKFISHITAAIEDGKMNQQFSLNYGDSKEHFTLSINEIQGKDGSLIGRIIVIKNITEQKNYEIQLTQMAEIRTKFISLMAHDLIGNVASHTLLVESLLDHPAVQQDEDLQASLNLLMDSSQNVTKFVEGLLYWSKESLEKIQLNRTKSDLYQIIDEAILYLNPISMQKDISYTMNVEKGTLASVDVNMIQTVIRNLISNAIKFSPPNGNIHIESIIEPGNITVTISDEGPGVDETDMNHFLSRYHMKSYKGGLGLTLCRDFVHLHKGEIKVQNKVPEGTIFSFVLPHS